MVQQVSTKSSKLIQPYGILYEPLYSSMGHHLQHQTPFKKKQQLYNKACSSNLESDWSAYRNFKKNSYSGTNAVEYEVEYVIDTLNTYSIPTRKVVINVYGPMLRAKDRTTLG